MAVVVATALGPLFAAYGEGQLAASLSEDRVDVTVNGKLFTSYRFAASQKYPYLFPLNGPRSGESVTTESSEPYPHHHSLFFACDKVNGGNYWQEGNEAGQIVSQGPVVVENGAARVVIEDQCIWRKADEDPIMRDRRRISVTAPDDDVRYVDFEIRLQPIVDVTIEKSNHSLFAARVVPELNVPSGGTLVNAEGMRNEKGTWGVPSAWCDISGPRNGSVEGIAILQHPGNPWFPCRWFTRDYGFFSPTPIYWLEGDRLTLARGESLALRYRVIVHAGSAEEADIAAHFDAYARGR